MPPLWTLKNDPSWLAWSCQARHLSRCATSQFSPTAVAMEVHRWTRLATMARWHLWKKNVFPEMNIIKYINLASIIWKEVHQWRVFFGRGGGSHFSASTFDGKKIGHMNFDPDHGWFYSIYPKKSSNPTTILKQFSLRTSPKVSKATHTLNEWNLNLHDYDPFQHQKNIFQTSIFLDLMTNVGPK